MLDDAQRLAPRVAAWLKRIGPAPAMPPAPSPIVHGLAEPEELRSLLALYPVGDAVLIRMTWQNAADYTRRHKAPEPGPGCAAADSAGIQVYPADKTPEPAALPPSLAERINATLETLVEMIDTASPDELTSETIKETVKRLDVSARTLRKHLARKELAPRLAGDQANRALSPADRLAAALHAAGPAGLSKTILLKRSGCTNRSAAEVNLHLQRLERAGVVTKMNEPHGRGRPIERWRATTPDNPD